MDDEVPGSVRADTAAAALQDLLPPQQQPGAPLQPLLISITVLKHSAPENSQSFIPAARALAAATGDLDHIISHTHPQMADPALAAAVRGTHRAEAKAAGGPAATDTASGERCHQHTQSWLLLHANMCAGACLLYVMFAQAAQVVLQSAC